MRLTRLAACAAFAAGLGLAGQVAPAAAAGDPAHDHAAGHGAAGLPGAATASLRLEPETPRAGERAALSFVLSDAAGGPLDELVESHERKLHAVIVSEDMGVVGHVHPEDFGETAAGGEAIVYFAFPHGGRYLVGIDFATEVGPQAAEFAVEIAGPAAASGPADTGEARVKQVTLAADDSYTRAVLIGQAAAAPLSVSLQAPERIVAGEAATFVYRFAEDGAAIDDLRPYLGAAMHVAAVKDDLSRFMHGHGESPAAEAPGHGAHGGHGGPESGAIGPEVTVTLTFPDSGRYFLFGQAARGQTMVVSRFAIEVE